MQKLLALMVIGILCFSMFPILHLSSTTSGTSAGEWSGRYGGATSYSQSTGNNLVRTIDTQSSDPLIINESQTWYGDFIVNTTDIVMIQSCSITIMNGIVFVYGTLLVENSSILIQHTGVLDWYEIYIDRGGEVGIKNSSVTIQAKIASCTGFSVWGNLAFADSCLIGDFAAAVFAWNGSSASVTNSKIPFLCIEGGNCTVSNCSLEQISIYYTNGRASIENSDISVAYVWRPRWCGPWLDFGFYKSNLTKVGLFFYTLNSPADLSLHEGYVENMTVKNEENGWDFTFSGCFIGGWSVMAQNLRLHDSVLERLEFRLAPIGSVQLTLENGFVPYKQILIESSPSEYSTNITVVDSEINEWYVSVMGGNVNISDSYSGISAPGRDSSVTVSNSTVPYVCGSAFLNTSITILHSSVIGACLWQSYVTWDLVLHDGYYERECFYNDVTGSNFTLIDSSVQHWVIGAFTNATIRIHNSTISSPPRNTDYTSTCVFGDNASVAFYDSTLNGRVHCQNQASLTLHNSSIDEIWAYDQSNVTLIDSYIGTRITDPTEVHLINSKIASEIISSFSIPSGSISTSLSDTLPMALPGDLIQCSKCLHADSSSSGSNEFQIRMYFDRADLTAKGIALDRLRMCYMEEGVTEWLLCPVQGVDADANYVWANVTSFSYFVLGAPATSVGGGGGGRIPYMN
jgi:hypothetical protein